MRVQWKKISEYFIYYSSIQPLHFSFFKGGGGCDERGGGKLMRFLYLVDLVCVCFCLKCQSSYFAFSL